MNRTKQNKKETQIKQINKINGWIQPEIRSIVSNCWLPIMIFPIYRIWGSQLCDFWLGGETKDARSEIDTFHDSLLSFFLLWWHFFFFLGGGACFLSWFFPLLLGEWGENEIAHQSPKNRKESPRRISPRYGANFSLFFVSLSSCWVSISFCIVCRNCRLLCLGFFPPPLFFLSFFPPFMFPFGTMIPSCLFFIFGSKERERERERERENCFGRLIESSQESNALLTCIDRRS